MRTEELIQQPVRETGEGDRAAKQVGAALSEILAAAEKVSGAVNEIAASNHAQARGMAE